MAPSPMPPASPAGPERRAGRRQTPLETQEDHGSERIHGQGGRRFTSPSARTAMAMTPAETPANRTAPASCAGSSRLLCRNSQAGIRTTGTGSQLATIRHLSARHAMTIHSLIADGSLPVATGSDGASSFRRRTNPWRTAVAMDPACRSAITTSGTARARNPHDPTHVATAATIATARARRVTRKTPSAEHHAMGMRPTNLGNVVGLVAVEGRRGRRPAVVRALELGPPPDLRSERAGGPRRRLGGGGASR